MTTDPNPADAYSRPPAGRAARRVGPVNRHTGEPPRPPQLAIAAVLLAIGGMLGWGAASLGEPATSNSTSAVNQSDSSQDDGFTATPASISTVTWTEAATVPPVPVGMEYAGFSAAVEIGDTIYLVVNYFNQPTAHTSSELWSSSDGLTWKADKLELGDDTATVELAAFGNSLLLTATTEAGIGLWRSVSNRALDGTSWTRIPMTIPSELSTGSWATVVNQDNEIVTMMIGNFEISESVLQPYLPVGTELDDPRFEYQGTEFLYGLEGNDTIQILAEPPEVFVGNGNAWIRLLTLDGEEVLQTIPLPEGGYPLDATPSLASIPVALMWRSEDGTSFLPVTGRNALPQGRFLPQPWGNGFVAAVYQRPDSSATNENVTMWTSHSGRAWQPEWLQPPRQCSPFFFAASGERIHLTGDDGAQCVRDLDGEWIILDQPSTVASVVGGGAGFIGYPDSFEYDKALFSPDGVFWGDVTIPASQPYPTLLILQDRLLALSVNQPGPGIATRIDVWIGDIGP